MNKLIFVLTVFLLPISVFANEDGEFCTLLEEQENHLTEKEKKTLEKYGFVAGISPDSREKYPKVLVSKSIENSCRTRYLIAGYFSDKIDGREYFMKDISLSESERKSLAIASCKALELTTNGSGVWFDGMGHEIYNIVDDIIFPYFYSCISDRLALNQYFGIEYFSENAFLNPNKRLVDQIYNSVRQSQSKHLLSEMANYLFVLKNGGRIAGLNTEAMLQSGNIEKNVDVPRDEVIRRAQSLLTQEGKISRRQYWDFEIDIWGI